MVAAVALAACLLPQDAPPPIEVDVFLVAQNEARIKNLDWLDKEPASPVQRLLLPVLRGFNERKVPYMVVDGGDRSLFPAPGADRDVWFISRSFGGYPSKTESTTTKRGTKSRVVETTEVTTTSGTNYVFHAPTGKGHYIARAYLSVGEGAERNLVVQDLNSFHAMHTTKRAQDRAAMGRILLLSDASLDATHEWLWQMGHPFEGVCIASTGLAAPSAPNFIAFPPRNVVGHYKLAHQKGVWSIRLVRYLFESNANRR